MQVLQCECFRLYSNTSNHRKLLTYSKANTAKTVLEYTCIRITFYTVFTMFTVYQYCSTHPYMLLSLCVVDLSFNHIIEREMLILCNNCPYAIHPHTSFTAYKTRLVWVVLYSQITINFHDIDLHLCSTMRFDGSSACQIKAIDAA